jgi:hypothetical protein
VRLHWSKEGIDDRDRVPWFDAVEARRSLIWCHKDFRVPPSLNKKRAVAGVYTFALILCASNYYLGWHLLGQFDKGLLAIATFIGVICAQRYGPALVDEWMAYGAAKHSR